MKAAFSARVNLVTQVMEGQESLELSMKPTKKSLGCSALKCAVSN